MVQISVQAVTPKPHTETFLKLDLEYKKRVSKKKSGGWRKQHNYNFLHVFNFFMTSLIHPCQKSTDPFKIWGNFQLWQFFKVAQS